MTTGRKIANLLSLAVLGLLAEGPTHPYEMDFVMRARGLTESFRLTRSSLYTVVEALHRDGLIVPQETQREGRRPERTVYALADAGRAKFDGWLRELLRKPAKEYPQFVAALTMLPHIPPDEAVALLAERAGQLDRAIDETQMHMDGARARLAVPRLFLIETEFALEQARAELRWVRKTIDEITDGTLAWPAYLLPSERSAGSVPEDEPAATDAADSENVHGEKGGGWVE